MKRKMAVAPKVKMLKLLSRSLRISEAVWSSYANAAPVVTITATVMNYGQNK
jgi:hypothetical protein